jgi:outer membrane receptor for ferrienterochelin and colicins
VDQVLRWGCVIAILLASARARADEPRLAAPTDNETVVVTGTRTPERVQRATVKTDVVTREEAERRGATNVADALASQPGLQVNPGSYGFLGGVSALQIQGFDRDRVLILEDGERVVGDVGGAVDLAAIPTADLERIEVVSGPTSSLYGSAALGGVVNIITAPPRRGGVSGRARAEYRSRSGVVLQGNAAAKKSGELGPLREPWIGLDANYTRQGGVERKPGLPDLRIPETQRRMIGLRGGMQLLRGGRGVPEMDVRIRMRAFRDRLDGIESEKRPTIDELFITDLPQQTDRYTLHVIHVTKFSSGASVRLTMGRQQFDNFTAKDRRGSPIDERRDRDHRMQSFEAVGTVPEGPRTWVAGTRFEAEHFEQSLTRTVSSSSGPVTTTGPEVVPLSFGVAAFYAQLSWKFGQTFTVMPGVRTELHSRYGESVAPRLAAAWQVTPAVTLRASAGRGFRAPSAKELGFVFDHSFYGYRIIGNRDLFPEKSWGVNADATLTPSKTSMVRGSVFTNWVEDLIDLDLGHGVFDGGVATYSYTNFGRARTAGGQIDTRFKPTRWLTAESSYAYTWTRDDVNDQPLPGRPPHSVTSSLRLEPGWKLEMYVRARVVTSSFLDVDTRSPGYQTVDVRMGRTLWPHSQAYVGALNLLDVKQDPGRIGDTRPPLGRILYIGLRADFPWEE